ncbi:hypothetical protein [Nocardia tengchongensis]|uniref:hypothetical protein n=1 Tax=Nocardia tengchongensis TaxID=2055889 RepID=UPI0036C79613
MNANSAIARLEMLANRMQPAAARGDRTAQDWLTEVRTAILELRQQPAQAPRSGGGFLESVGQGLALGAGFAVGEEIVDDLFDW